MHLAVRHGHQAGLAILVEAVQVGLVLEEVHVQLLVFHGDVGLHVVAEFLDLQIHTLGFELGFDEIQDFGVRHGGCGHFQHGVGSVGAQRGSGQGDGGEGFLQHRRSVSWKGLDGTAPCWWHGAGCVQV